MTLNYRLIAIIYIAHKEYFVENQYIWIPSFHSWKCILSVPTKSLKPQGELKVRTRCLNLWINKLNYRNKISCFLYIFVYFSQHVTNEKPKYALHHPRYPWDTLCTLQVTPKGHACNHVFWNPPIYPRNPQEWLSYLLRYPFHSIKQPLGDHKTLQRYFRIA